MSPLEIYTAFGKSPGGVAGAACCIKLRQLVVLAIAKLTGMISCVGLISGFDMVLVFTDKFISIKILLFL